MIKARVGLWLLLRATLLSILAASSVPTTAAGESSSTKADGSGDVDPSERSALSQKTHFLRRVSFRYGKQRAGSDIGPRPSYEGALPSETVEQYGVSADLGGDRWPVDVAADLLLTRGTAILHGVGIGLAGAHNTDPNASVSILELDLGLRKFWKSGRVWPYVGGGGALLLAKAKSAPGNPVWMRFAARDTRLTPWASAGVVCFLSRSVSLGVEAKYIEAELEFQENPPRVPGVPVDPTVAYMGRLEAPSVAILLGWQSDARAVQTIGRRESTQAGHASGWVTSVHSSVGLRALGDGMLPVESEIQLAVITDTRKLGWPIAISIDVVQTAGSGFGDEAIVYGQSPQSSIRYHLERRATELDLGVRWTRSRGRLRPFIAGGAGFLGTNVTITEGSTRFPFTDNDLSTSLWVQGGAYLRLGRAFDLGLETRTSVTEVELEAGQTSHRLNVQGISIGILGGWTWGETR